MNILGEILSSLLEVWLGGGSDSDEKRGSGDSEIPDVIFPELRDNLRTEDGSSTISGADACEKNNPLS
jgi:hypothetical protein